MFCKLELIGKHSKKTTTFTECKNEVQFSSFNSIFYKVFIK